MRHSAISPDGTTIAFTYRGDIFTVPVEGGKAQQITSNPGFDGYPVWSPDSRKIAFASNRQGSMDVYLTGREGGTPQRLTTHSGSEKPITFIDNETVLFSADIQPAAESIFFPSNGQFQQVYSVSAKKTRPQLVSSLPMECISINKHNEMLYQDKKGYEDYWRKHHKSPITRDIWLYTPAKEPHYTKLTVFAGEDRNPVWAPDGKSFYYLSEEGGSFNVYRRTVENAKAEQITHFKTSPVRFLSVAGNGTLCYGYDGELYTQQPGQSPKKVNVEIRADQGDIDASIKQNISSGATEMAVSPTGKEVAFIVRGDVYVTSLDYNTTRQITNTPYQERSIDFSPDGRTLVYASERDGLWQVYTTTIVRKDEKQFTYATELKEERLTKSDKTSFLPKFSPDGKEVAFLEERTAIRVINLKSKAVRTVMDKKYEYSYMDGDQWYQWSPDSKWILSNFIGIGGWNNKDVVLLKADGKEMINLTESGYNDGNAKWVLGGKAMIWESDRAGYRSHGSWGAESDVYIMFFDADAYDRFIMSKEEVGLREAAEKLEKEEKEKADKAKADKKKGKKENKKEDKDKKAEELKFDLENRFDRILRLTVNSSHLGDAVLDKKGENLYYLAAFEGGFDLWKHDLKENSTKIMLKGAGSGSMEADKDVKNLFLCTGGGMKKIALAGSKTSYIGFSSTFDYRPFKERRYIFNHIWSQVNDKFYVKDMQGVDWKLYKKVYEKFLPHISNGYDFTEMLSEMLGELNASHTGARYYGGNRAMPTATLGLFYDDQYKGDGLKIKEIIEQSPFAQRKTEVVPGCIIEKIDGEAVRSGMDYYPLLQGKAGKRTVLTIFNPATKKRFEEIIKPISQGYEKELLYRRWVKNNEKRVEELSNGRLAYIHIKGMDSQSFRNMYSKLLGKYRNKEAVVVDVRHNGGGWLHDDVVTLLSGKQYEKFVPRGQFIGNDPFNKWLRASCMLVCEDNYSNAHGTPFVYKTLGVGKLIGTPVAGTMTAVWWERQIDPDIVFGIPQVGCMDMQGNYLENKTLQPDILIYNSPEDMLKGNDVQLKKAVEHLLETVKK